MTEALCSHGNPARHCDMGMHTVWRFCPTHEVGWSIRTDSGCWETDEHGGPCLAEPMLGEPPRPKGGTDGYARRATPRRDQVEAAWVLDERLARETS